MLNWYDVTINAHAQQPLVYLLFVMAENHKIKVNPKLLQSLQKIIKEELTNNAKKNECGNEESDTTFINALCKVRQSFLKSLHCCGTMCTYCETDCGKSSSQICRIMNGRSNLLFVKMLPNQILQAIKWNKVIQFDYCHKYHL